MERPNINVTPLIDVLLVLLIIFMIVTPTRPSSMDTNVPSPPTATQNVEAHPDTLIVVVSENGAIRLNTQTTSATVAEPEAIAAKLREAFNLREASGTWPAGEHLRKVFIKAPRKMSYGEIARVVDAVRSSGATPVALQIDDLD